MEDFVSRCAADDRINGKFARTDIPRLKKMLVDQVTQATGGPATYSGRDMKETHAGMGVTAGEFDALVEDLVASLDHLAVPKEDQGELLGLLAPMRGEIVEIGSTGNGTAASGDVPTGAGARLGRSSPGSTIDGAPEPLQRAPDRTSRRPHNVRVGSSDLDRVSLLLSTYLFQGLSPAELEPLARSAMTRHAARGEYVHHVGDPANEIYLVAAGQLKDSIVTEEGDELVHTFYGPGMLIGEPGFFATERNRVMAVVAVEPTTLLVLGRDSLEPFLQRHPRVVTRALEGLASVARNQTLLIATLSRRTLQERLLFRLVELADSNSPRDDGAGVTPKISQATLAAMVGVTRENVNRALSSLAGDGVIRIEAGAYVLPDLERLRAEISNGSPMLTRRNRRIEFDV